MTSEWTVRALQALLEEAEDQDRANQTKYRQMVTAMTPVDLLQRVDRLAEQTPGLTRESILVRALHVYLLIHERMHPIGPSASGGNGLSQGGDACAD